MTSVGHRHRIFAATWRGRHLVRAGTLPAIFVAPQAATLG